MSHWVHHPFGAAARVAQAAAAGAAQEKPGVAAVSWVAAHGASRGSRRDEKGSDEGSGKGVEAPSPGGGDAVDVGTCEFVRLDAWPMRPFKYDVSRCPRDGPHASCL